MENLSYAVVQVIHNVGAIMFVAVPFIRLMILQRDIQHNATLLIILAIIGGSLQLLSGAGFAFVSHFFHGQIPEIEGIAFNALVIKISCVVISIGIYLYLIKSQDKISSLTQAIWRLLGVLAIIPLISAAFLRWYG